MTESKDISDQGDQDDLSGTSQNMDSSSEARPPSNKEAQTGKTKKGGNAQKNTKDKVSFEEALKQLEGIVHKLESGDLGLEDSLRLFEDGIRLSHLCNKKLESAERKIEMLTKDEKGGKQALPADID